MNILNILDELGVKELSLEEELSLMDRYKNENDLSARDQLLESMLKKLYSMVVERSNKFKLNSEDYFARANELAVIGIDNYVDRGNKPSNYIVFVYVKKRLFEDIKKGIKDDTGSDFYYSTNSRDNNKKIFDFINKYEELNGDTPSIKEISKGTKINEEKVKMLIEVDSRSVIGNVVIGEEENLNLFDVISDESVNVENSALNNIFVNDVEVVLNDKEKELFNLIKENIDTEGKINKSEIGRKLNITSQRVDVLIKNIKTTLLKEFSVEYEKEVSEVINSLNDIEKVIYTMKMDGSRVNGISKKTGLIQDEVKEIYENVTEKIKNVENKNNVIDDFLSMVL